MPKSSAFKELHIAVVEPRVSVLDPDFLSGVANGARLAQLRGSKTKLALKRVCVRHQKVHDTWKPS